MNDRTPERQREIDAKDLVDAIERIRVASGRAEGLCLSAKMHSGRAGAVALPAYIAEEIKGRTPDAHIFRANLAQALADAQRSADRGDTDLCAANEALDDLREAIELANGSLAGLDEESPK